MELKHKSEWPMLIKIANIKILDYNQTILLLALREVENGGFGIEFKRLDALGNDLDSQARSMCNFIKDKERDYQNYIKRLDANKDPFSFVEYVSDSDNRVNLINAAIDEIRKDFETIPKEI